MYPREPLPVTAGPELFDALGGRAAVGVIVDGLYDRLERDEELSRLFRNRRRGERDRLKEFFEGLFGGEARGFDLNVPIRNQETPLTMACRADKGEHPETVAALLDLGADPNAPNAWGRTALSIATSARFCDTVALLLAAGAR